MAVDKESRSQRNLMKEYLVDVRESYIEENGEEPSDEFMEEARAKIIQEVAKRKRDANRDIYDALADE